MIGDEDVIVPAELIEAARSVVLGELKATQAKIREQRRELKRLTKAHQNTLLRNRLFLLDLQDEKDENRRIRKEASKLHGLLRAEKKMDVVAYHNYIIGIMECL